MKKHLFNSTLLKQSSAFLLVGLAQLVIDWIVFVLLSYMNLDPVIANVIGRTSGALLGFVLNGRFTFSNAGASRLGWRRFLKFMLIWIPMTIVSTFVVSKTAVMLDLRIAWLAKPIIEGLLAIVSFFLWKHVVYR